jgi:HK97 family phage prohead protease
MRPDYMDLHMDLIELRDPPLPASTRALMMENAITDVEQARLEVRSAVSEADEKMARHHLALAAGHLAKVTKLHPGVKTWTPPKLKKKTGKKLKGQGTPLPPSPDQKVYQKAGRARLGELRGTSERRFVGEAGQARSVGARRRLEVRNLSGGPGTLVNIDGAPVIYNQPYAVRDILGEFTETMMPGVASHLLKTADVRFLVNHSGLPLARTTAGNLKLSDSQTALRFSATVDRRQNTAADLVIAIERGDVSQMSVGFLVETDSWDEEFTQRTVTRLSSLNDISAVTFAASPSTTIALAGMGGPA